MKIKKRPTKNKPKKISLKDQALARLIKSGITPVDDSTIDEYFLKLPRNITLASGRDIGEYLYAVTQQKGYLRTLVAVAEVEVLQTSADYDEMYGKIYNNCTDITNVNDKKEFAKSNPLVLKYRREMDEAMSLLKLASSQLEALNDTIFALSREITRRERQAEHDDRNHNVGNIKKKEK